MEFPKFLTSSPTVCVKVGSTLIVEKNGSCSVLIQVVCMLKHKVCAGRNKLCQDKSRFQGLLAGLRYVYTLSAQKIYTMIPKRRDVTGETVEERRRLWKEQEALHAGILQVPIRPPWSTRK